jgi:hypothetical protein
MGGGTRRAVSAAGTNPHALLWSGSAGGVIDLNPAGFITSDAFGTNGNQQVGSGSGLETGNTTHALLWNGSASSYVDLNPADFVSSLADATNGTEQVGEGVSFTSALQEHAVFWEGTASSCIDLQSVLPSTIMSSRAYSISGDNVFGFARDNGGYFHAIEWTVTVPEPACAYTITLSVTCMLSRRRRTTRRQESSKQQ